MLSKVAGIKAIWASGKRSGPNHNAQVHFTAAFLET